MLKHVSRTDDWSDKNIAQKGFTLVELLVVVIILGILAAAVIFAVGRSRDNAEANRCAVELRTLRTAVEAHRANPGGDPDEADLVNEGYITEASDNYNVAGGNVTVQAGGGC